MSREVRPLPEKEIQMPCSEICLIAPSDALGRKGTKILIEEKLNAAAAGIPGMLSDYMDAMKKARQISCLIAFFSYDDLSAGVG
ncbi:Uncharacterised protein [Enterocloster clostridioformis]|jgi:hypothetical protein|uniref:Uncharacterized protein n=2 Tax=Enterocloster clostridioformis TaxID=1531 RepID=A0A174SDC1_9FIRM|nr:Uncharacterised protein [Enterocloster clostridioformis]SQB11299.1 Uncharacterised protein [Enterocloster clostridioformis]